MPTVRATSVARVGGVSSTDRLLREALEGYGLRVEPRRFVDLVRDALREVMSAEAVADAPSQLTNGEAKELRMVGLDVEEVRGASVPAAVRTAATMTAILAGSLTVEETAARLGVTPGRIRQMLADRSLVGIRDGTGWRIPAYELDGDRPVRNLRTVLRAVPPAIHPVALFRWLTGPDPALGIEGQAVSPRDWLAAGGDPEPVAALAAEL
jgi:excisionase family DNA binding protein